jgi:hypothetical protein
VHLSPHAVDGKMWPAQFHDESSLRDAWEEFSTEQDPKFNTMLHHLGRLFKEWQECSVQEEEEGRFPCKPANYFSLIKHERLEEFIDYIQQPVLHLELFNRIIHLVPLSALLLHAVRLGIPPELVWFTPALQAQGETQDTNTKTFTKWHSELFRLCPTVKASDGGDRFVFAARDALSHKEIFVKQTIVPSSEEHLENNLQLMGNMLNNECCFAFPIDVQNITPRGEDDVGAWVRKLVDANLVPLMSFLDWKPKEDRVALPVFLENILEIYDEMWKKEMPAWNQGPSCGRGAARQNSSRASRFKIPI